MKTDTVKNVTSSVVQGQIRQALDLNEAQLRREVNWGRKTKKELYHHCTVQTFGSDFSTLRIPKRYF